VLIAFLAFGAVIGGVAAVLALLSGGGLWLALGLYALIGSLSTLASAWVYFRQINRRKARQPTRQEARPGSTRVLPHSAVLSGPRDRSSAT